MVFHYDWNSQKTRAEASSSLVVGLFALGAFAIAYSLYGGLRAVALTDIIQVVLLVLGGLLIAWILLDQVAGGAGPLAGFSVLTAQAPEKFHMILQEGHPHYMSLPGLSVLVGGMWIMNISYWGFNQYIIQRALGAKSVDEAQKGIAFAAFLKLLMPLHSSLFFLQFFLFFLHKSLLSVLDQ